ncbi:hypothetical protein SK128_006532 [Halocaridina rubra]|uniref:Uncharacterized protein n=1 Tax=Halocaridina rubra TaxID=373956 RepID=A0AAN8WL97_HALRR
MTCPPVFDDVNETLQAASDSKLHFETSNENNCTSTENTCGTLDNEERPFSLCKNFEIPAYSSSTAVCDITVYI